MTMHTLHFDCACHDLRHTVRFSLDIGEDELDAPELYLETFLPQHRGLFGRLKQAVLYVLKRYPYTGADFDATLIRHQDVAQLKGLVAMYEAAVVERGVASDIEALGDTLPEAELRVARDAQYPGPDSNEAYTLPR
jgi:hypothetical protein